MGGETNSDVSAWDADIEEQKRESTNDTMCLRAAKVEVRQGAILMYFRLV